MLKLPRELRDSIYEFDIVNGLPIRIKQNLAIWLQPERFAFDRTECEQGLRFTSSSAIIVTSRQLHDEYFQAFDKLVLNLPADIKLEVTLPDMLFHKFSVFLKRLTAKERHEIAASNLHIRLVVMDHALARDAYYFSGRVMNWCGSCDRWGITATYEVVCNFTGPYTPDLMGLRLAIESPSDHPEAEKLGGAITAWRRERREAERPGVIGSDGDVEVGMSALYWACARSLEPEPVDEGMTVALERLSSCEWGKNAVRRGSW